jgi:hypothetical protein
MIRGAEHGVGELFELYLIDPLQSFGREAGSVL